MTSRCPQNLAELLRPLSPETFFDTVWGKTPRHIEGQPGRLADLLSVEGLIKLLTELPPRLPGVTMLRDGVDDPDRVVTLEVALRGGTPTAAELIGLCGDTTLVLNGGQHRSAAVGELARMLFTELNEWTTANIYFSPAGGSLGLGYHYDCWEIFVLQLEGSKAWELFPTLAERPVDKVDFGATREPTEEHSMRVVLSPGDVLYMPRGTWHRPHPTDSHSLHLTVGVHCKMQLDLTEWLWRELSKDAESRADLPLSRLGHEREQDQRAAVKQGLERIRALIDDPDAVSRFLAHRFEQEAGQMWPKPGSDERKRAGPKPDDDA